MLSVFVTVKKSQTKLDEYQAGKQNDKFVVIKAQGAHTSSVSVYVRGMSKLKRPKPHTRLVSR